MGKNIESKDAASQNKQLELKQTGLKPQESETKATALDYLLKPQQGKMETLADTLGSKEFARNVARQ